MADLLPPLKPIAIKERLSVLFIENRLVKLASVSHACGDEPLLEQPPPFKLRRSPRSRG